MKFTIRQQLLAAFASVITATTVAFILIAYFAQSERAIQSNILENRQPTAAATIALEEAMQHSLAALRGYMLLGADENDAKNMLTQHSKAWSKIKATIDTLNNLSPNWSNPENRKRLQQITSTLDEFEQVQRSIIAIAHSPQNIPAIELLTTQAAPQAEIMFETITAMIESEVEMEADSERKVLLKTMADFRGSMSSGMADVRAYLLTNKPTYEKNYIDKLKKSAAALAKIQNMKALLNNEQLNNLRTLQDGQTKITPLITQLLVLRKSDDWNKANYQLGNTAAPLAAKILANITEMRISQLKLLAEDSEVLNSISYQLKITLIAGWILATLMAIIIALRLSQRMVSRIDILVARADAIAKGDLSAPALNKTSQDEFGTLARRIDIMQSNLKELLSEISSRAFELSSAGEQLQSLSQVNLERTESQQSETNMIATAMEEMAATVNEVARNAETAATAAQHADESSLSGRKVVETTVLRINTLAEAINNAATTINTLGQDTASVDKIVAVISSIAEQTNLLALNAAIEAARAGEQGRGFAVVADEVRSLAARTQKSTLEISTMLDRLRSGVQQAVTVMSDGHTQAGQSVNSAGESIQSFNIITESVGSIRSMNDQIATASEEQSAVAAEMSRNILSISDGSTCLFTNAQEGLEASTVIKKMADNLKSLTQQFKI